MSPILISILILGVFAALYSIAGYCFFSVYHEKIWFVLVIIPLAAIPFYYYINHLYARFWSGVWSETVWILACYFMSILYGSIRRRSISKLQKARDEEASILEAALENASEVHRLFALYLRPFTLTKNIPTSLPGTYYTDSEFDGVMDFEAILEDALQGTIPLVALGRPQETYGAGRITSDERTWQAKVIQLMQAAQTIFLIPSDHSGTLWEIQHIYESDLIKKCIFVMPPMGAVIWKRKRGEWQYDQPFVEQGALWAQAQHALEKFAIHLPDYHQTGALFTMSRSGERTSYSDLPLLLPKFTGATSYTRSLQELIDHLQAGDASDGIEDAPTRKPQALPEDEDEVEYEVKPGGFEIRTYSRSTRGKLMWWLFLAVFVGLTIFACLNLRTTFLLMAETFVAGILAGIFIWPIERTRELMGQQTLGLLKP